MSASEYAHQGSNGRDEFLDRAARVVVTTEPLRKTLAQDRIWRDRQGTEIPVERIDARYAENILRFVEQRAKALHKGARLAYFFYPEPRGEMAQDAFYDEQYAIERTTPEEWLNEQPLVARLRRIGATASTSKESR